MLERRLLSYQPGVAEGQDILRNSSQAIPVAPTIVKHSVLLALIIALQSCSPQLSWKESYLHRQWERAFLTAQSLYQDANYKDAGKSYLEAITYANQMEADANKDAAVRIGLANCYAKLDAKKKAEVKFNEANAILRAHLKQSLSSSEKRITTENLEHSLFELGKFHYSNDENDKAENELEEAKKLLETLGSSDSTTEAEYLQSRERAVLLAYLFNNQQKRGQNTEAESTAEAILSDKLRYAIPAKVLEDIEKKDLNLLNQDGKTEEAKKLQALTLWLEATMKGQEGMKNHDYAEAEKYFKSALQIAQSDKKPDF
ncbi:MAG: hypothetical protein K2X81_25440, partial [Candidatus Obscuribacterales bacterium]|nr:hypothetical protein [Candidatus Obscuribacterales bacterium]